MLRKTHVAVYALRCMIRRGMLLMPMGWCGGVALEQPLDKAAAHAGDDIGMLLSEVVELVGILA